MEKEKVYKVLLDIRGSAIFSKTLWTRFWLFVASLTLVSSLFVFWHTTYAPVGYPRYAALYLQSATSPLHVKISRFYHDGVGGYAGFDNRDKAQSLAKAFHEENRMVLDVFKKEEQANFDTMVHSLQRMGQRHTHRFVTALCVVLLCYFLGFICLKRYLRRIGVYGQTGFLFLRIVTPSVFKAGAFLFFINALQVSFELSTVLITARQSNLGDLRQYLKAQIKQDEDAKVLGLLDFKTLTHIEQARKSALLRHELLKSLCFYISFGALCWMLGRRWSKIPLQLQS